MDHTVTAIIDGTEPITVVVDQGDVALLTYDPSDPVAVISQQGTQGAQGIQGDPGVGVPAGGSTGQALVKSSNTDYAVSWDTVSGGAGTDPYGMNIISDGVGYIGPVGDPGFTINLGTGDHGGSGYAQIFWFPLIVDRDFTCDMLSMEVTTGGGVGALVQIGVFGEDRATGKATTRILQGAIDASSTGIKTVSINPTTVPAGRIWLACFKHGELITSCSVRANAHPGIGVPAGSGHAAYSAYGYRDQGFGAVTTTFPDPFPAASYASWGTEIITTVPQIRLRAAA